MEMTKAMRTITNKDWSNLQAKILGWLAASRNLEEAAENPDFYRGQQVVLGNLLDFMIKIEDGREIWVDEMPITIDDVED